MQHASYGDVSLERMVRAVEKVRERLLRSTSALDQAGVPYAVAGGNAVHYKNCLTIRTLDSGNP